MKKLLILPIMAISLLILTGCNSETVQQWDNITVSYDSFLQDGKIIEEWTEVSFIVWMWQTFPIFDTAVVDMQEWESKEFTATAEEWYSIYHDNTKVQNIASTVFNKIGSDPKVGEMIALWDLKGLVMEVSPITIKVDFNEIQAREPVKFKIKILEIKEDE